MNYEINKDKAGPVTTNDSNNQKACMASDYNNILVIKPSALGDVARAIPAVKALRDRYPQSHITWLIRPEFADLIKDNPAVNDIILFDKKKFSGLNLSSLHWAYQFSKELKSRKFDLVLDMQGLLRSGLMTWQTKAPVRIGLRKARELAWLFYNERVYAPQINHANDDCWRIAQAAGIGDVEPDFGVPVRADAYLKAEEILTQAGIKFDNDFIVLLPGATAAEKIWPADKYGLLADAIYNKYQLKCVLLGAGLREKMISDTIIASSQQKCLVNLVGKTQLAEMVAILTRCRLVIGNDSGPLHVAAALPRTVLGIYGATNPDVVGPVSQRHNVIEAGTGIARTGRYSQNEAHNINNISVGDVLAKLETIFAAE